MATMHGSNQADKIKATTTDDLVSAASGNDKIYGGAGNDTIRAGGGNDTVYGGSGHDLVVGDESAEVVFKTDLFAISEKHTVKVTFDFEEAGYRNTLGCYKVDAKTGQIHDVKEMWANASLAGSGGDLIGGKSSYSIECLPGEKLGFFLVGNGFATNNFAKLGPGKFAFVDGKGGTATIDTVGAKLVHVSANGKTTTPIEGPVYHTAGLGDRAKLNADGIEHAVGYKKSDDGTFQIGFEDLWKGGDRDFDDAVFTVDIGKSNVDVLNKQITESKLAVTAADKVAAASHMKVETAIDQLHGGTGNDTLQGMQGNDLLAGGGAGSEWKLVNGNWTYNAAALKKGALLVPESGDDNLQGGTGNDVLLGGRGNDRLDGGDGNDTLNAGQGNDLSYGGAGNDVINGEDGNDYAEGGAGNDIFNAGKGDDVGYGGDGDDSLRGAEGNDSLYGGEGKDELNGGVGADLLDAGAGDDKLFGGDGGDRLTSGAGNDYAEGGLGDDSLDGGDGDDRLLGNEGQDILFGGAGKDTLVGGAGTDKLEGGAGDDQLWGGSWSADGTRDVFAMRPGGGRDTVQDFEIKCDQVDLSAYGLTYKDLASRIVDKGWATEIDLSGLAGASPGDALILKSIKPTDLTEDKFLF